MAESKTTDTKTTDTKTDTKTSGSKPKANRLPAAESSNPEVQTLLAELQTARLNDNDDGAKKVRDRITDLGYAAD